MNDAGTDEASATVAALIERHFGPDAPRRELARGETLMRAGDHNTRLYRIEQGSMLLRSERRTEVRLGPGNLIGIQSLFLHQHRSVWTDIADEPTTLAWVDLDRDCPGGGAWAVELMPLVVAELNDRQQRVRDMEEHQRRTEQRLQELTWISTLGQMAAGVAHELNTALAVLGRGTDWIRETIDRVAEGQPALRRELLAQGLAVGHQRRTDGDPAARAKRLRRHGLGFGAARRVAGLPLDDAQLERVLAAGEPEHELVWFELGATLRDMAVSATQAGHVVHSLKQLAARERLGDRTVDLQASLEAALSICRNALKGIAVTLAGDDRELTLEGNQGELVQVWTNLIQNACDALHSHRVTEPRIAITVAEDDGDVVVAVSDNGPGIDPTIADDLFMPHVTTKTDALHFGLGLGLSIVQQLVRRYGGEVTAGAADGGGARFTVRLPRRMGATTQWINRRLHAQEPPYRPEDPS